MAPAEPDADASIQSIEIAPRPSTSTRSVVTVTNFASPTAFGIALQENHLRTIPANIELPRRVAIRFSAWKPTQRFHTCARPVRLYYGSLCRCRPLGRKYDGSELVRFLLAELFMAAFSRNKGPRGNRARFLHARLLRHVACGSVPASCTRRCTGGWLV